jgi:hypothetical protein
MVLVKGMLGCTGSYVDRLSNSIYRLSSGVEIHSMALGKQGDLNGK